VVHEEAPAAIAPFLPMLRRCCFHCGAPEVQGAALLQPCKGCFVEAFGFCSAACRLQHGTLHARECNLIPALKLDLDNSFSINDSVIASTSSGNGSIFTHVAPFK
jgi:hypothetical protein